MQRNGVSQKIRRVRRATAKGRQSAEYDIWVLHRQRQGCSTGDDLDEAASQREQQIKQRNQALGKGMAPGRIPARVPDSPAPTTIRQQRDGHGSPRLLISFRRRRVDWCTYVLMLRSAFAVSPTVKRR